MAQIIAKLSHPGVFITTWWSIWSKVAASDAGTASHVTEQTESEKDKNRMSRLGRIRLEMGSLLELRKASSKETLVSHLIRFFAFFCAISAYQACFASN